MREYKSSTTLADCDNKAKTTTLASTLPSLLIGKAQALAGPSGFLGPSAEDVGRLEMRAVG